MSGEFQWRDVGERVQEARLAAGLSQAELAARLDLDRTMIAKIETGSRRVDALELIKLSNVLGLPMEHFLRRSPVVLSRRTSLTEDTSTDVTRNSYLLEAALEAWLRDVRQMIALGCLAPRRPMTYPGRVTNDSDARQVAMWLRAQLALHLDPIDTLMDVCARAGQLILVTELPGDGASLVDGDVAVAVISVSGDPGRRRATAAHELGHLLLGDEYSTDLGISASRREREDVIDVVAAELLLPVDAIGGHCDQRGRIGRPALVRLAARYRTSWSLAVRQAQAAGALDGDEARRLSARRPTRAEFMEAVGWEPLRDLESVRVPPIYADSVMAAWRAGRITSARAVELMHGEIDKDDLPVLDDADLEP